MQIALALVACCTRGQGTLVYDQQSVTTEVAPGIETPIQTQQPIGQSFTPTISSVGFIRLYLSDQTLGGSGSTVDINLWSGSIETGTLLDTSTSVFVSHGSFGYYNFFFSTPVGVTSGATYYFQPIVVSGDSDNNMVTGLTLGTSYPNGTAYINGSTGVNADLLFREGIVAVPEPSVISLAALGLGSLIAVVRNRRCLIVNRNKTSARKNHSAVSLSPNFRELLAIVRRSKISHFRSLVPR